LRLFYYTIVAIVGAALLPVIPAAAKSAAVPAPRVASAPSAYTAVNPARVLDTRAGSGIVGAGNTLGPGASFSVVVAPNATAGVPANATAVVMNVTVTNTTAASYLTVYPTLASLPFASNLNWVAGYTVPNLVTVQPGTGGAVTFYNKFGSTDVIADIAGYYAPPSGTAGGEVATGFPQRLVDTRTGSGFQGAGSAIGPAATASYQVTGKAGVPATGVSAVIVNATVTNTTAASFLTLWAGAPAARNTVSNANWVAGWTRANRAIVPVSSTGMISVYNQFGSTDVILDVNGYYTDATASGKLFTSVSPIRLADHTAVGPNSSFNLSIGGVAGVPLTASAVVLDAVTSETTAASFLTVAPSPGAGAATSDINWVAGQVNPNLTVTTLGTAGQANFYNSAGNANVSVDLEGFFGGGAGVVVTANPASLPANAAGATSKVNVTVNDANGNPIALDPVSFALTPSVAGSCGSGLTPATTNGAGQIPQETYTPTNVPGTCLITATEAIGAKTGSVTITQTPLKNTITFTAPAALHVDADGVSTLSFSTTTANPVTGPVAAGDMLTFTTSPSTAGSCGAIGTISGTPAGATNGSGVVTFVYTASATVGFCTITATEAATGGTNSAVVTQNVPGAFGVDTSAMTTSTTGIACTGTAAGSAICVNANGKDTVAVKDTVTGASQNADSVMFSTSASVAGACGTLSSTSGTTTSLGVVNTTYTASTTPGKCTITASEANSGSSATFVIGQDVVAHNIALAASPQSVVANGTSTSALTATVTDGVTSAAVSADAVAFATSGTCGAVSGSSSPSNASGVVTATYTSTAVSGFCQVTATDASGGSGTVRIDQTKPGTSTLTITAVSTPATIPADTATTTTLKVTVTASGTGIVGDPVQLTWSESAAGTCPTTTPSNLTTGAGGVTTLTWTSTAIAGTCTITATEANSGSSAASTLTQTAIGNAVTFTAVTNPQPVGGAATAITAHVAHLTVAVNNDTVSFSLSANPAGSCGTLSATSGNTGSGNTGNVTVNYTPSAVAGFCTVTATESATASSASTTIDQTSSTGNITTLTDLPATNPVANGTDTRALTATITGTGNHINDTVMFTTGTATPAGACGTITVTSGNTGTGNTATATYKASTTAGTCVITATEANGNSSGTLTITQTQRPNNITLTANPTTVSSSSAGTSTLTVTVTDGNTAAGIAGDAITFTTSGTCGTITGSTSPTNSSGVVTATYTSSAAIGSCVITATEQAGAPGTGQAATFTMVQTA
jgi:hypothetical protein